MKKYKQDFMIPGVFLCSSALISYWLVVFWRWLVLSRAACFWSYFSQLVHFLENYPMWVFNQYQISPKFQILLYWKHFQLNLCSTLRLEFKVVLCVFLFFELLFDFRKWSRLLHWLCIIFKLKKFIIMFLF